MEEPKHIVAKYSILFLTLLATSETPLNHLLCCLIRGFLLHHYLAKGVVVEKSK